MAYARKACSTWKMAGRNVSSAVLVSVIRASKNQVKSEVVFVPVAEETQAIDDPLGAKEVG